MELTDYLESIGNASKAKLCETTDLPIPHTLGRFERETDGKREVGYALVRIVNGQAYQSGIMWLFDPATNPEEAITPLVLCVALAAEAGEIERSKGMKYRYGGRF